MSGQFHAPAALPPGETALDTYRIGGCRGPRTGLDDVKRRKISDPSAVRPVASHYTDWAIPAGENLKYIICLSYL
jgi:hypothetical protein